MPPALPQAPPPDWRQYVLRTIIWVAFIGALGYAAANGGLGFLENDISLTLEPNRETVALSGKEPPVIQVKITLRNNTGKPATFTAPSACKVFRWQIFDTAGAQVQARYDPSPCPDATVTTTLASGASLEEFYSILLIPERFQRGQKYLAHVRYWDQEGEFTFTTE